MRAPAPRCRRLFALSAWLLITGCQGIDPIPKLPVPTPRDRERYARMETDDALAFRAQGRLEAAERAARRAVAAAPRDARSLRVLALVLEESGRPQEAGALRARAAAIDPPPPMPPETPLDVPSQDLLVLLAPQEEESGSPYALFHEWPDPAVPRLLVQRLRIRLPGASVTELEPASVAEARAWLAERAPRAVLSLRVERAACGDSRKDGPFALAWLTAAAATPEALEAPPQTVREVVLDPETGADCRRLALAHALEGVLAEPAILRALRAPAAQPPVWPSPALRALFPSLGRRIEASIARGRARLATGRIAEAEQAFLAAAAVDPDDLDVQAYVHEARTTLALAREIAQASPGNGPAPASAADLGVLEIELTSAQRAAAEAMLREERERRDTLLAALSLGEDDGSHPRPAEVATLRPIALEDPDATGPRLARARAAGSPIERRALFTPQGAVLAVYYFAQGGDTPVLRESDRDGDGAADRWTAYADGARREVFEDRRGSGVPDTRLLFDRDGAVEEIQMLGGAGRGPLRVFRYAQGRLAAEEQDTDGDGVLDRFERFDVDGNVTQRDEDLDGDGTPDVRSFYEAGRLVRREFTDADVAEKLLGR